MVIYLVVLISLVVYARIEICKYYDPNSRYAPLTHGKKTDDVATLLERVSYANNINGKINHKAWCVFSALVVTFFATYYLYDGFCGLDKYVTTCVLVAFLLMMLHNFYDFHVVKFVHFATDENIKTIRKKLKLSRPVPQPNVFIGKGKHFYYNYK